MEMHEEHRIAQGARRRAHPAPASVAAPSLKDATRQRPGAAEAPSKKNVVVDYRRTGPFACRVTCEPMWTAAEFRTFDRLSAMVCSTVISERARAQVWLQKFKEKHGKDKCAMMMAEVRRRDELEWFKSRK